ncbi:MAG: hypothetical protein OEW79_02680 [Betaproteobacteria bacterium]|jgi:hypothetical protein|nr:hypothetical protein [Betaproteobacteria bacterium]MDH4293205.1 hypothetical protein [Betaproteobacteria bacterium]MDH5341721.1 hypothetical protein [Betaproteobacteria bacterium]
MRLHAALLTALLAAGFLLNTGLSRHAAAETLTPVTPPVQMPAFRLPGLNGSGGSDADLRNKVTIIRFWASW